jgi:lipopolysaccharide transport system ATP-binding protein
VERGEVLGIIGKNGAGKSTLLKILSKVTAPTTGTIKSRGRIASLLEVGTGFNGEMTGRENIFLNGAILGMTKKEITAKLDDIIDFSGCERYIDTPVKRYSSGMTVRLAFAVAAFLEPEILVIDEVLAVGDAEFQKKAIGKMQDISRGEGRTVLFVSHNMAAVKQLCTRGIVLENGGVVFDGGIEESVDRYLRVTNISNDLKNVKERLGNKKILFKEIKVFGENENLKPSSGTPLNIEIKFENKNDISIDRIEFDLGIEDDFGQRVCWISSSLLSKIVSIIPNQINIKFPINRFNNGKYYVTIYITVDKNCADWIDNAFSFDVSEGNYYKNGKLVPNRQSKVLFDFEMNFK